MPKRILVTGVSSSPGYGIAVELARAGHEVLGVFKDHEVRVEGVEAFRWDLERDPVGVLDLSSPDLLIHAASMGNVDLCEEEPAGCYRLNVEAARRLAAAASRRGVGLIYLSTDYVFDGSRGLYSEEDVPRPINYYGLTKLAAEEAVRALGGSVVRVSAVFGPGPGRVNFARHVVEKLSRGEAVEAAEDQFLSPTYNMIIGKALAALMPRGVPEIVHVAGPRLSRYQYAVICAEVFGLPRGLVRPTTMSRLSFRAPRPKDSSLDNRLAASLTKLDLNNVREALKDYREKIIGPPAP